MTASEGIQDTGDLAAHLSNASGGCKHLRHGESRDSCWGVGVPPEYRVGPPEVGRVSSPGFAGRPRALGRLILIQSGLDSKGEYGSFSRGTSTFKGLPTE